MKTIKYIIYKEGKHYVSQSLNVDVSSFGNTIEEATANLKEALDLYFEDEPARNNYIQIKETLLGELNIQM
jgi:predicted RNase H-like HicB family nuclease